MSADERRKILDTAYSYSSSIGNHIIKCVVYGKADKYYNHWIDEISTWITDINSRKPKKGFKLKPKDYKDNLFVDIGDEVQDAKRELLKFQRRYTEGPDAAYPEFEITQDLYFDLFDCYWELANMISKKLGKYNQETAKADITSDIHRVLDKYC